MNDITDKQYNYIKKFHYHLKRACPQSIIDKYDLLRMPKTKSDASKYITYAGNICRANAHLLNEEDKHTDRLHLNQSVKTLYADIDEFGDNFNDHFSDYPSINCKDDM